mgnify:CR=1 FL=1
MFYFEIISSPNRNCRANHSDVVVDPVYLRHYALLRSIVLIK